jgi:hypothetical protein
VPALCELVEPRHHAFEVPLVQSKLREPVTPVLGESPVPAVCRPRVDEDARTLFGTAFVAAPLRFGNEAQQVVRQVLAEARSLVALLERDAHPDRFSFPCFFA